MDSLELQRLKIWLGSFPTALLQDSAIDPNSFDWLSTHSSAILQTLLDFLWKQISAAHNAIETIFTRIGYANAGQMPPHVIAKIRSMNAVIRGGVVGGWIRPMGERVLSEELFKAARHWAWLKKLLGDCLKEVTDKDGVSLRDLVRDVEMGYLGEGELMEGVEQG